MLTYVSKNVQTIENICVHLKNVQSGKLLRCLNRFKHDEYMRGATFKVALGMAASTFVRDFIFSQGLALQSRVLVLGSKGAEGRGGHF